LFIEILNLKTYSSIKIIKSNWQVCYLLKLDFGWSTILNKPRKTYCGTVDYLAPEMIDKSGHDEKLDIWCIGVLVY
jgi:serine/threonine protein kinase